MPRSNNDRPKPGGDGFDGTPRRWPGGGLSDPDLGRIRTAG